jgi:small GTP-binding protein
VLPKEMFATTDAPAILAAYRRFVLAREAQTLRPLNELKLLVVGNEAVGKTSLLRYLIKGEPRNPNEIKTPGIAQHEKIEVRNWSPDDCQVRVNVWDFGGQEMMRGTHRFFLTERSLYLLVLEDRRQDDRSIYEWMKTIRNCGGDSPVIVVINKSDAGKQDLRLDEKGLQETFPNIVGFLRTSCDASEWAAGTINNLRREIVGIITRDNRLKRVRDSIPKNWLAIKTAVTEMAGQRSILPHADFVALCRHCGDSVDPVIDESEQRALLRLLHELGAIVAYGLERNSPAARREITLLDPNWLTGAIYRILDKASSVDQEGEFFRRQLDAWLDPRSYPSERHEFILDMMQDEDIGLCFRLPISSQECYLVPEALPASRRFFGKWPEDSLRFRYKYSYLPPSLIPRLIVESHKNLTPEKSRWRTGVVLAARNCQVLVLADPDKRRVDLQVDGPPALRRAALNVVLNDLEAVHDRNPEAEPVAVVPLPDRPEVHVGYDHLSKLERLSGSRHSFIPDGADRLYEVGELLDGVRRDESERPQKYDKVLTSAKRHVVILVHGIRTTALWQDSIRKILESNGFVVQLTNYGFLDLFRFLFPWHFLTRSVVNEIEHQIRHVIKLNDNSRFSIIAHSFGTFVIAKILSGHTDLEFERIIFCGSVISDVFRIEDYSKNFKPPLINEVGTRDFWPVIAQTVTFGYGSAGTCGFRRPGVHDRWHNGKSHSAFLDREFCRKYWAPFLRDGEIIEDDQEAERPPFWLRAVSAFQIRYVLLITIIGYLGYLLWHGLMT